MVAMGLLVREMDEMALCVSWNVQGWGRRVGGRGWVAREREGVVSGHSLLCVRFEKVVMGRACWRRSSGPALGREVGQPMTGIGGCGPSHVGAGLGRVQIRPPLACEGTSVAELCPSGWLAGCYVGAGYGTASCTAEFRR